MVFTKHLREGIRRGRIRCSIRIWTRPHVKVDGRYQMDDGHIVVDSIAPIEVKDITYDLARESGFASVEDLLAIARHGRGEQGVPDSVPLPACQGAGRHLHQRRLLAAPVTEGTFMRLGLTLVAGVAPGR